MADNVFEPLIDSIFQVGKFIHHRLTMLPTQVNYQIDNRLHLGEIYIPIGITKRGIQYLHIGGEQSHSYVVGQTGSGKSNLVKVILSTLINNYPNVDLILLDYKRVELSLFKNTKNCIGFEWDSEGISRTLDGVLSLVLDRYSILDSLGETEANILQMKPILVVIEEISLMSKATQKILRRIMAISRAVNIYTLITTQRPSNEILDNVIKSLVGNRICLKTEDIKNSLISLDAPGCELLRGKGHGIIKSSGYTVEFQAYHIQDNTVKMICDKHKKLTINVPTNEVQATNIPVDNNKWIEDL